jgi:arylsulfatase A-like enzyme
VPNLIVVIADQLAAHVLDEGEYVDLPTFTALRQRSLVFSNAQCAFPLCVPSRASMLTGRLPHTIGVMGNKPSVPFRPTLGHHLRQYGYRTGWAGKWHCPEPELPDSAGFEKVAPFGDIGLVERCADWLRDTPTPFVLAVSFDDPHTICEYARGQEMPYGSLTPPPVEDCPPLPDNSGARPYDAEAVSYEKGDAASMYGTIDYTEADWRRYRWVYRRLVERIDTQLGRLLLETVRGLGLADDTHIIVTSDHGDGDGAHGWNQKLALFRETTRIPFIITVAGRERADIVDAPVQVGIDLVPTVCSLLGIPRPDEAVGVDVTQPTEAWPHREVVTVTVLGTGRATPPTRGWSLVSETHTYTVYSWGRHREQLHAHTDQGQMRNLAVESASRDVLEAHRRRLLDWCLATADPHVRKIVLPADITAEERAQVLDIPY